jgi:hypothetical protein
MELGAAPATPVDMISVSLPFLQNLRDVPVHRRGAELRHPSSAAAPGSE